MQRLLATTLLLALASLAQAQDDAEVTLADIRADCAQWAADDMIDPGELQQYIDDCVRLEAESYGLTADDEDADDSE